jgi:YHS domain-containing protein
VQLLQNILYFAIWAGFIFLMMRYGCGAHIMGHGHHQDARGSDDYGSGNVRWIPPDRAVDPVCGMTVQTVGAKSAVHDGHVYYFCSQDCREKFEGTPASYVKVAA